MSMKTRTARAFGGLVVAAFSLAAVAGCGEAPDGGGAEGAGRSSSVGAPGAEGLEQSQQAAVGPSWARRGAAAVEVNRGNGGQELWVVVCSDDLLKFRIKKINGKWGSWTNTGAPCTATPSLAVWPTADSPEVPVAYFRNNNALMEMTFLAADVWQLTNLSDYTGFGELQFPGQMDPLVTYFDTVHKQIALLAWKRSDNLLYSIDYYSRKWHYTKVVGNVPGTARTVPWFSKDAGENTYFSYPISRLHAVFHRGDIVNAYEPWKILDNTNRVFEHLVTFGGLAQSCVTEGCAFTLNEEDDENGRYAPLTSGNPTWTQYWFKGYHFAAPVGRHGGDPSIMFSFGGTRFSDENALFMIDFKNNSIVGNRSPPGPPNSLPVLPVNVYAGSQYEHDMFYTVDVGGKRALYYVSYDPSFNTWTFKDMGINVSYSL